MKTKRVDITRSNDKSLIRGAEARAGSSAGQTMNSSSPWTLGLLVAVLLITVAVLVAVPLRQHDATIVGSVVTFSGDELTLDTSESFETFTLNEGTVYPAALDSMDMVVVHYYERAGEKTATRITADLDSNNQVDPSVTTDVEYPEPSA